jgi:hypothetical protein
VFLGQVVRIGAHSEIAFGEQSRELVLVIIDVLALSSGPRKDHRDSALTQTCEHRTDASVSDDHVCRAEGSVQLLRG